MKYNMGMSDKKTRARASKRGSVSAGKNFKFSKNYSNPSSKNKRKVQNPRSGFRKFSKLGVTATGIASAGNKRRQNSKSPSSSRFDRKKIKSVSKKVLGIGVLIFLGVGMISSIGMGLYLKNLENSLPDPNKLIERSSDQSTILYDRNGEELFKIYGEENRQFVSIDKIPDETKWALLAAEDVEFYQHKGLDWKGIVRCGFLSVRSYFSGGESGGICGASTITQQLVRNTLMFDVFGDEAYERSTFFKAAKRKLRELLLSMQVERTLSKDEILQLYMNEVPLGGVNYGYGAAAESYFNKSVSELDLAESAMLAGLIQSPSIYSPVFGVSPEQAPVRQNYVLDQLKKHRSLTGISEEDIEEAREQELAYGSGNIDIEAYHFVFYIKQVLEEEYGPEVVERGGLRVTTSLDLSTQKIAQEEVTNGVIKYGNPLGVYNGGMVVLDPNTGQILAMVGSVDPNKIDDPRIDGNVNMATSLRQMGSSFKPYVYLTAFQQYGPWFEAPDIPMNFGNYKPENWDDRYYGLMVAREALIKSRNIPANYTMQMVGIDPVIATAEKVGITTLTDRGNYGLSLALGAAEMKLLEHAQGFSVFATGGVKRDAIGLLKVEDPKGNILYEYKESPGERVFEEQDVYMLNWVLCDLGGFGDQPFTQSYNINGKRATCGKTGTTNGPKDLVSIQYHKNLVVAMWSGNNNGDEVPGAWSTTVPLPIVHSFMERVSSKYVPELPTRPSGILAGTVCSDTGRLAGPDSKCKKVPTIYVSGRAPKADSRESFFLCKENGKVPTNLEQAKQLMSGGEYTLLDEKTLLNFTMENAQQQTNYNKYIEEKTEYIATKPESAYCEVPLGPGNSPLVTIESPSQGTKLDPGDTITIEATARAEGDIDYVEIYFGNNLVKTIKKTPYKTNYTVPSDSPDGSVLVTVKVVDGKKRTGTASVSVNVDNPQNQTSISINWPNQGAELNSTNNVKLEADVSGASLDSVTFAINGPSNYSWSGGGSNNGSIWTANWNDPSAPSGNYSLSVSGGGISEGITFKVNK